MNTPTVRRVYLNPPRRSRKGSESYGLGSFLRDNSAEIAPGVLAWFYALGTSLVARDSLAIVWYLSMSTALSVLIYFYGYRFRALRQFTARPAEGESRSRRQRVRLAYVLSGPYVMALWATWATWPSAAFDGIRHRPSAWGFLVLIMVGFVVCIPWWFALRSTRKISLWLEGMTREQAHMAIKDAKLLIRSWTGYTGRAGLDRAKLRSLRFTVWSRCISVEMRHGAQTLNFTALRMNRIETASLWTLAPNMARIDRDPSDGRRLTVRYMLADPHAATMPPPAFEDMEDETVTLGLFENAAFVIFEFVNTLIAGLTGAGKSALVNTLVRALAKIPHVAMIGFDLKPGAPELGPWRNVFAALADDHAKAHALLDQILIGLERRGQLMLQRGWRTWLATIAEPFLVVIVDEIQELDKPAMDKVARIGALIRAYGGILIVATQYPIKENLPSKIKQNLSQRIGFRTADATADRVIFGDSATRTGWTPSTLCPEDRPGSFLIRNRHCRLPMLARGWFSRDDQVTVDAVTLTNHRTEIDRATWHGEIEDGEQAGNTLVMVERITTTREQVLNAIELGIGTPKTITEYTEIPERSVKLLIKQLADAGDIEQDGPRKPWRIAVQSEE